jgi:hypothetical protein
MLMYNPIISAFVLVLRTRSVPDDHGSELRLIIV